MVRRSQLLPWKLAGRVADRLASSEEVVRSTGWLFNSSSGGQTTLAEFVRTGDDEVAPYLLTFALEGPDSERHTLVEIGAGIGRMTSGFTRAFGSVIACDLDAGFLERCYETVGRFGLVGRLRTSQVVDGRSLNLPNDTADVTFSYLTLQHCGEEDAIDLSQEAVRVTKPGGKIALNFRRPSAIDPAVMVAGHTARQLYRVPKVGEWLTGSRFLTRLAWQASRLHPDRVTGQLGDSIVDATIWVNPSSTLTSADATIERYEGVNPHHWWIVATIASPVATQTPTA